MLYTVQDCNFYTDEHSLNNIVFITEDLEKAKAFVLANYDVTAELNEPIVYSDDEDDEYGERFVLIETTKMDTRI